MRLIYIYLGLVLGLVLDGSLGDVVVLGDVLLLVLGDGVVVG